MIANLSEKLPKLLPKRVRRLVGTALLGAALAASSGCGEKDGPIYDDTFPTRTPSQAPSSTPDHEGTIVAILATSDARATNIAARETSDAQTEAFDPSTTPSLTSTRESTTTPQPSRTPTRTATATETLTPRNISVIRTPKDLETYLEISLKDYQINSVEELERFLGISLSPDGVAFNDDEHPMLGTGLVRLQDAPFAFWKKYNDIASQPNPKLIADMQRKLDISDPEEFVRRQNVLFDTVNFAPTDLDGKVIPVQLGIKNPNFVSLRPNSRLNFDNASPEELDAANEHLATVVGTMTDENGIKQFVIFTDRLEPAKSLVDPVNPENDSLSRTFIRAKNFAELQAKLAANITESMLGNSSLDADQLTLEARQIVRNIFDRHVWNATTRPLFTGSSTANGSFAEIGTLLDGPLDTCLIQLRKDSDLTDGGGDREDQDRMLRLGHGRDYSEAENMPINAFNTEDPMAGFVVYDLDKIREELPLAKTPDERQRIIEENMQFLPVSLVDTQVLNLQQYGYERPQLFQELEADMPKAIEALGLIVCRPSVPAPPRAVAPTPSQPAPVIEEKTSVPPPPPPPPPEEPTTEPPTSVPTSTPLPPTVVPPTQIKDNPGDQVNLDGETESPPTGGEEIIDGEIDLDGDGVGDVEDNIGSGR